MTETQSSASSGSLARPGAARKGRQTERRRGPFARLGLFYRQIVAELRKVVWPSRSELRTYTTVVIVFVVVIIGLVALLDYGFSKAVLAVFG